MAVRRQERRGTRAQWVAANPVLAAGEIGVETADALSLTNRVKVGDGVKTWTALSYVAGGDTGVCDLSADTPTTIPVTIRRQGDDVTVTFNRNLATDSFVGKDVVPVPPGFEPDAIASTNLLADDLGRLGTLIVTEDEGDYRLRWRADNGEDATSGQATLLYKCTTPWPTSLPS